MAKLISGRVWKFGHNIDTDVLAPWKSLSLGWEERKGDVLHIRPGFVDEVKPGDLIVAGRNWGCGSSREQAAENIKNLGIAAVVAESFGRIYFRNSIALALPGIVCPGVYEAFSEGDKLELDLQTAVVKNVTCAETLQGQAYTAEMLEIIDKGGLMELLKERMASK
jgi:3-isopropylmalate/(R)-2-methylmalate dehydratase small subunit